MSSASSGVDALEALGDLLEHLRAVVAGELGGDGAGLDQRHADAERHALLAQRLRERADAELREVVDARRRRARRVRRPS